MKEFITHNFSFLITSLGYILWVIYMFLFQRKSLQKELNGLMLSAKQQAKDGILKNGAEQEEWVVKMAMQKLPRTWTNTLGEPLIRKMVGVLYKEALSILESTGKLDGDNK